MTLQNSVAPVIASKTLPLVLRAATPTSPIIMTPAPTFTVVTTLGNTLLASPPCTDPQNSQVNFQPVIQTTNQGAEPVRVMPNSTVVVSISLGFFCALFTHFVWPAACEVLANIMPLDFNNSHTLF